MKDLDDKLFVLDVACSQALEHLPSGDDGAPPCSRLPPKAPVQVHRLARHSSRAEALELGELIEEPVRAAQ